MVFSMIIYLVVFIFPILYLLNKWQERKKFVSLINKIPGPPSYPLIGTIGPILMMPRGDRYTTFNNICKSYGPIVRTWTGPMAEIHLRHPDYVEKILGSSTQIKKAFFYSFVHEWLGNGLLTSTGTTWHQRRKLITPTFHFKILESFMDVFVEKSNILVNKLKNEVNGNAFDVYPYITNCALDIICETAMGTPINAQEKNSNIEYIDALYELSELTIMRLMRPWLHNDFLFALSSTGKKYKKNLQILHDFTNKVIQERKAAMNSKKCSQVSNGTALSNGEASFYGKKRMAFLDLLLDASENGHKLSDENLREEVDTFMFAGHDTTTSSTCWALYVLGLHKDVQDKVYEEIISILGDSERAITSRDIQEMKYLEQVIKETMRLYSTVGWISRELTEDVELGGYKLPKGLTCTLQINQIHKLEEYYPNPEKFNPDNFSLENIKGRHPYAYIPFSAGLRNCIGQKFALMEEKTMLASILRNYKIKSVDPMDKVKLISELVVRPENGIHLQISAR